ncbi:MAG TPA: hypothetical protein VMV17_17585 [Streptosporangiaceae bacterium]|nr:hypothetical protein [Streptosporangiaceae bacterium]
MEVVRPTWWRYPERCANGHEWGPGLIIVGWSPFRCEPALVARGSVGGAGHRVVHCGTEGRRSTWYVPRHDPDTA